ncbi:MAG: sigma-70 family RNA polymerase sigma factor [Polyangiaceae bacterium]|nr:sigma-70 family RNA polymerase sigma factor [Polyangiaceae bacterium]
MQRRTLSREEFDRYSPVVRRTAMWVARRAPKHVTVSDLCAKGWVGLLDALASAEAMGAGELLDDYASARIRGAMLDYLWSFDEKLREARRKSRLLARAIALLHKALDRAPEELEIAAALSMGPAEYEALLTGIAAAGAARLELLDFDAEGSPVAANEADVEPVTLETALAKLPRLSQQVVSILYQDGCTPSDAAEVLGIDVGRVQRIHTEAMHRLRANLGRE